MSLKKKDRYIAVAQTLHLLVPHFLQMKDHTGKDLQVGLRIQEKTINVHRFLLRYWQHISHSGNK